MNIEEIRRVPPETAHPVRVRMLPTSAGRMYQPVCPERHIGAPGYPMFAVFGAGEAAFMAASHLWAWHRGLFGRSVRVPVEGYPGGEYLDAHPNVNLGNAGEAA